MKNAIGKAITHVDHGHRGGDAERAQRDGAVDRLGQDRSWKLSSVETR